MEGVACSCAGEGAAAGRGHRGSCGLEVGLRRGAAGVGRGALFFCVRVVGEGSFLGVSPFPFRDPKVLNKFLFAYALLETV